MDTISAEKRSENMSKIRGKNTKPELLVRKVLTEKGVRYRLHSKIFPGRPDIVIRRLKTIIFVNGCFWHQHKGCKRGTTPKTNKNYWINKLNKNVQKQNNDIEQLKKEKWNVIILWECELKDSSTLKKKLKGLH